MVIWVSLDLDKPLTCKTYYSVEPAPIHLGSGTDRQDDETFATPRVQTSPWRAPHSCSQFSESVGANHSSLMREGQAVAQRDELLLSMQQRDTFSCDQPGQLLNRRLVKFDW
jgi:hypothetical protein